MRAVAALSSPAVPQPLSKFWGQKIPLWRWCFFFFFFSLLPFRFFFLLYFFFLFVVNFVIHWNETAMGLHVFPIPIPPPTGDGVS